MPFADRLSLADGAALLHPLLMILFVYPVGAVTVRLATHVRERRLDLHPQPASVLVEHAQHGQWLTSGAVLAVLLAQLWGVFLAPGAPAQPSRAALLALLALASLVSALALWWARRPALRLLFALLSWSGLLSLALLSEGMLRQRLLVAVGSAGQAAASDLSPMADPALAASGASAWLALLRTPHAWAGLLICGLLLASTALRASIGRRLALRRLHALAGALVSLLMVFQAISGCRALLSGRLAG
jgi:hypothetical protein